MIGVRMIANPKPLSLRQTFKTLIFEARSTQDFKRLETVVILIGGFKCESGDFFGGYNVLLPKTRLKWVI